MFSISAMTAAFSSATSRTSTGTSFRPASCAARKAPFASDDFVLAGRVGANAPHQDGLHDALVRMDSASSLSAPSSMRVRG